MVRDGQVKVLKDWCTELKDRRCREAFVEMLLACAPATLTATVKHNLYIFTIHGSKTVVLVIVWW